MDEILDTTGIATPGMLGSSSTAAEHDPIPQQAVAAERMTWRRRVLTSAAALTGAVGLLIWRDLPSALLFLGCAALTCMFLPAVGRFARRNGAVALPGGRGIHTFPTPLIGGAALFIPVALTLLVLGLLGDSKAWGLLAGGTIVFLVGLYDDLKGARARHKILAQLLAGGVLLAAGFRLPALGIPGVGMLELSPLLGAGLLLFWVVLATNALNLSDGLDGLATSLTILGMGVLAAAGGQGLVPVALAGACLGFLYFNLPRARIFLGDAGSLLLGFLLAALVLQFPVYGNVPLALAAFAYPLGDVCLCVLRRLLHGKPLFAPDRSHIHHKALQYFGSPTRALLGLLAFAGLQAAVLVTWPGVPALVFCLGLWILLGAVLAFFGSFKPARIMLTRRGMRQLHIVRGQVEAGIKEAQDRGELEQVLGYLAEAVDIDRIAVGGLQVALREMSPTNIEALEVRISLRGTDPQGTARFCTWSAAPTMAGPVVDQERETIMAGLLRQASDRLQRLDPAADRTSQATPPSPTRPAQTPTHSTPLRPDVPLCSPIPLRTRRTQGQA